MGYIVYVCWLICDIFFYRENGDFLYKKNKIVYERVEYLIEEQEHKAYRF